MDPPSTKSLQDLCIDSLAKTSVWLDVLWTCKEPLFCEPRRVEWKDPEVFLNSDIADKLLERLSYEQNLDDSILCTFTNRHVHLQNVRIGFCHHVTGSGLQVLGHHKLRSLRMYTLRESDAICTVLSCIGDKSYESLQHLGIWRHCEGGASLNYEVWPADDDFVQQSVVENFSRFNCLRSLDIRGTNLSDTNLAILGKSLPHVENLDLSWNWKITDISPLKNCQKTLKSLSLCEISGIAAESTLATFVTLSGLTYLDVSLRIFSDSGSDSRNMFTANILLQTPDVLPNLVCLDLSRRTVTSEHALRQFLDAHQSLQSLIMWGTPACELESLQDYRPRLTVGGSATLEQYTAALRHYNRTIVDFDSSKRVLVGILYNDIKKRPFPPCLDNQLVQELLNTVPDTGSFVSYKRVWYCATPCLQAIGALLEKGLITHLEPNTKQHLILLCHRAIQHCTMFPSESLACCTAVQILQLIGDPEPPHRMFGLAAHYEEGPDLD